MRCRAALSGGAGGFSHADQQATTALVSRSALKSGVSESYYAHLQKLGTVPTSILKLDNSTKSRLTETIQRGEREKRKPKPNVLKKKKSRELEVLPAQLTTYRSTL